MRYYEVVGKNYANTFVSLKDAKEAMKKHNAKGRIVAVRANGEWEPLGEIKLKASNKHFVANTKAKKKNY